MRNNEQCLALCHISLRPQHFGESIDSVEFALKLQAAVGGPSHSGAKPGGGGGKGSGGARNRTGRSDMSSGGGSGSRGSRGGRQPSDYTPASFRR